MAKVVRTSDEQAEAIENRIDNRVADVLYAAQKVRRCPDCDEGWNVRPDGTVGRCHCYHLLIEAQNDLRKVAGKEWEDKMPFVSLKSIGGEYEPLPYGGTPPPSHQTSPSSPSSPPPLPKEVIDLT